MTKISGLSSVGTLHSDDLLIDVDTHDTSMAATGTDKKLTVAQLASGMTALGLVAPGSGGGSTPVTLTDASTVAVNAALGTNFRLLFTSGVGTTRLIGAPSNPADGQQITLTFAQDSSGGRVVTWASAWGFPVNGTPILSTAPSFVDVLSFTYNASLALWLNTMNDFGYTNGTTLFQDNFAGPSGSLPSAANWAIQVCGYEDDPTGGSMNYRDDPSNVYVNGSGQLVIAVTASSGGSTTAQAQGNYCSARISTFQDGLLNGAASVTRPGFRPFTAYWGTYTVVAKIATTGTVGFWPAIWCYGASAGPGGPNPGAWPAMGEIDVLEQFGTASGKGDLTHGYGDIIGPGLPGTAGSAWGNGYASVANLETPAGINVADGSFHTFQMIIPQNCSQIAMYCDGTAYTGSPVTETAWKAAASTAGFPYAVWPFGPGAMLGPILNVATGGPTAVVAGMPYPASGQTFPANILTVSSVSWTQP